MVEVELLIFTRAHRKIDEVVIFQTLDEADTFCQIYNSRFYRPKEFDPPWFMQAKLVGDRRRINRPIEEAECFQI